MMNRCVPTSNATSRMVLYLRARTLQTKTDRGPFHTSLVAKQLKPLRPPTRNSSSSSSSARNRGTKSNQKHSNDGGFFHWYSKRLDERPWSTKIVSSALIAAAGDVVCQVLEYRFDASKASDENRREPTAGAAAQPTVADAFRAMDWHRTGRFLLIGAFWVAPATHLWYGFLGTRLVPGVATPKRILQRLALDQFGAAPVFCPAFMGLLWLLEGKAPSDVAAGLVEAGPTLVTSNWKLWIPAMGIMFATVPLKFQVVYSNFVGLVWTVYLSYASTRLAVAPEPPTGDRV
ncbi:unnamed protein product [Pseudo-nitzschia multistriata]|uniref:Uncharacterized protein n=1 Tax=Pseudo-nitzschia multistriata TaxID=183589 RepID=A0A448YW57_9STRA|nr:unnamed protein product [Pseudo-nitzschia multistriata]